MTRRPLSARVLGLKHLPWAPWQRALLLDGPLVIAVLLVLADLASAWVLLVLPLAVALVIKANDVLAGRLQAARHPPLPPTGAPSGARTAGAAAPGQAAGAQDPTTRLPGAAESGGPAKPAGLSPPSSPGPEPDAPPDSGAPSDPLAPPAPTSPPDPDAPPDPLAR